MVYIHLDDDGDIFIINSNTRHVWNFVESSSALLM